MSSLEVAKSKVADLGAFIDHKAVQMFKRMYIDDGLGERSKDTEDRLEGEEVNDTKSNVTYTGIISQIFALGRFDIQVMVRDGGMRPEFIKKMGVIPGSVVCT